jgi:hypothetical protein
MQPRKKLHHSFSCLTSVCSSHVSIQDGQNPSSLTATTIVKMASATPDQKLRSIMRRIVRPRRYFQAAVYMSLGGFLNGYAPKIVPPHACEQF